MLSKPKTYKAQINYKSGISMVIEAEELNISRTVTGAMTVEWKNATPRPLLIGVEDIESVWEL